MDQRARVEGREIGREGKVIPRLGNNNIIDQRILKIDISSMHIVVFSGKQAGNHGQIINVIKVPSNIQPIRRPSPGPRRADGQGCKGGNARHESPTMDGAREVGQSHSMLQS